ncbi:MAG: alpha/beta fold hydrolase [Bacteroidota bacterium]
MPILDASDYSPPLIFKNGNINTIYPFLFRKKIEPPFRRERFETSDEDFIDLDWLEKDHEKLVVLCHGLEGSSESQYIRNISRYLHKNGWDVLCINFRSCSGEMNRRLQMYHSGFTRDVHEVLEAYVDKYSTFSLVGFSLGGNVVLKYISDGIYEYPDNLGSVVTMSVPIDLSKGAQKIASRSNWVYDKRFRITMEQKIKEKHSYFPEEVDLSHLSKIKSVRDFDEYYTGPIHGFDGAEDYYSKCNSKQFLHNISLPTLLITAVDDPFLPVECLPFSIADEMDNFYFMAPKFGGHVGFTTFGTNCYWNEHKTLLFINDPSVFADTHQRITHRMHVG